MPKPCTIQIWKWNKPPSEYFKFPDHPLDRQEYIRLLWSGHVSIHLFGEQEAYGGCSHREAVHCDNIPVTQKVNEYRRINGNFYPFYTDNKFENLKFKIDDALDNYEKFIESDKFKEIKMRNKQMSSFESISNKVIEDIRSL